MPELVYALKDSGANILITDRVELGELADVVEHVISLPDQYEALLADAKPAPLGDCYRKRSGRAVLYGWYNWGQ